ncbi:MAG: hypothetical protein ABI919_07670, partial [Ramlibacter sp.]
MLGRVLCQEGQADEQHQDAHAHHRVAAEQPVTCLADQHINQARRLRSWWRGGLSGLGLHFLRPERLVLHRGFCGYLGRANGIRSGHGHWRAHRRGRRRLHRHSLHFLAHRIA